MNSKKDDPLYSSGEQDLEREIDLRFEALRIPDINAPSFLVAQSMRRLEEQRAGMVGGDILDSADSLGWISLRFRKIWLERLMWSSAVFAVFFIAQFRQHEVRIDRFAVDVQKPAWFEIRPDLTALKPSQVRFVQAEVSEGTHFYNEKYPEVGEEAVLSFPVESQEMLSRGIPMAVRADGPGRRSVRVRFIDESGRTIQEKYFEFEFTRQNARDSGRAL